MYTKLHINQGCGRNTLTACLSISHDRIPKCFIEPERLFSIRGFVGCSGLWGQLRVHCNEAPSAYWCGRTCAKPTVAPALCTSPRIGIEACHGWRKGQRESRVRAVCFFSVEDLQTQEGWERWQRDPRLGGSEMGFKIAHIFVMTQAICSLDFIFYNYLYCIFEVSKLSMFQNTGLLWVANDESIGPGNVDANVIKEYSQGQAMAG